jgi:hypothetical protein
MGENGRVWANMGENGASNMNDHLSFNGVAYPPPLSNDHQSRGPTRGRTKKCGPTGGRTKKCGPTGGRSLDKPVIFT